LSQEQLARVVLPLGAYHKSEIRQVAEDAGFPNAQKSDSQDICFIPDGDYPAFIEDFRGKPCEPGDIKEVDGSVVGQHKGLIYYTIGQRKGIGAFGRPVFVQSINAGDNSIIIGDNEDELKSRSFLVRDFNGTAFSSLSSKSVNIFRQSGEDGSRGQDKPLRCNIKIGYKHAQKLGAIEMAQVDGIDYVLVTFDEPQRAITPGQAAVFYNVSVNDSPGDTVLGGGTIHKIL